MGRDKGHMTEEYLITDAGQEGGCDNYVLRKLSTYLILFSNI